MKEWSCFLIKPDQERSDLIAMDAVKIALDLGLTVCLVGEKKLSLQEAVAFYKDFNEESWFFEFIKYLMSGNVKAYFTDGEGAIEKTLEIKKMIREKYAIDKQKNAIHAPKEKKDIQEAYRLIVEIF